MQLSELTEKRIKTLGLLMKALWMAAIANVFFITIIPMIVKLEILLKGKPAQFMTGIFTAIALIFFIISFIFRKYTLSPSAVARVLKNRFPDALYMNKKFNQNVPEIAQLPEDEKRLMRYVASIPMLQMLQWGSLSSCLIMGLPVSILTGSRLLMIPFSVVTLIALMMQFPNIPKMIKDGIAKYEEDNAYMR